MARNNAIDDDTSERMNALSLCGRNSKLRGSLVEQGALG